MNCRKNKHATLIREYRDLIGEQAQTIKEQQEKLKKLENNLESLKEASNTLSLEFRFFDLFTEGSRLFLERFELCDSPLRLLRDRF